VKVTVNAGPGFEDVLPAGATNDSTTVELASGATLAELFADLGLDDERRCMSAVNDTIVTRAQRDELVLEDGDSVDILPPLTGG